MTIPISPKVKPNHQLRQALIYIRQSTLMQVRENTGSTARQYDLKQRALALGWDESQIRIIDQDQGQSGASSLQRSGFQELVTEVSLGHVGLVCCLEASRLARASSDWHRLLELCALTDTLVLDEDGVYHPSEYNDRLLLGIKGTMSEAELHWLHQRLLGGKLAKAQAGELRFRLPTGLVYAATGQVILDPDQEVQGAVRLVFDLFEHTSSAMKVVRHFTEHHLRFPTRHWGGERDGELEWGPLFYGRVLAMLHNPAYAGAYVYGRTQTRARLLPGEEPRIKGRTRQVKRPDWQVMIQEAHPGYLSWSQFQHNQERLADNQAVRLADQRGAPREGGALLQGIVLCGVCGRRMSIRYLSHGVPSYECCQAHTRRGEKTCQSMRGDGIDAHVAQLFLAALQPAELEVALSAIEQVEAQSCQVEQQWQRRLERARYEADLARRRFRAVEPENRLVARSLEREWNDCLAEVERLEQESTLRSARFPQPVSPEERQLIVALAQDLPTLWQADTTTQTDHKQLLRLLIKDVTLTRQGRVIQLGIRWQTGALTEQAVLLPKRASEAYRTSPQVIDRVRELAQNQSDDQIAEQLNREGFHPGRGGVFTRGKVQWIRHAYQIPTGCPGNPAFVPEGQRADGRYPARVVAQVLNIHVSTVADWCRAGRLDSVQAGPRSPRWIKLTPEHIAELRKPIRRHHSPASSASSPSVMELVRGINDVQT